MATKILVNLAENTTKEIELTPTEQNEFEKNKTKWDQAEPVRMAIEANKNEIEAEKKDLENKTLKDAEAWINARLNATTLDNQTKTELFKILKKFAAFLIN